MPTQILGLTRRSLSCLSYSLRARSTDVEVAETSWSSEMLSAPRTLTPFASGELSMACSSFRSHDSRDIAGADGAVCLDRRFVTAIVTVRRVCTFDASCSTANPYVWKWQFYWGDGTNTYLEGSPYFTHQYSVNYATVTLKVHSFQTPSLQEVSCEINIRNIVGPPFPTWGRCTN